jgi:hypothetical protein
MIILNKAWDYRDQLSGSDVSFLQYLLPFPVHSLLEPQISGRRLQYLYSQVLHETLKDKFKKLFVVAYAKSGNFGLINFKEIYEANYHIKRVVHTTIAPGALTLIDSDNSSLKKFYDDLSNIGINLNKITNGTLGVEDFSRLCKQTCESALLKGTEAERGLINLTRNLNGIMASIQTYFMKFEHSAKTLDLLSPDIIKNLEPFTLQKTFYQTQEYTSLDSFSLKLLQTTTSSLKRLFYKQLVKCMKAKEVKLGIGSNLAWSFYALEEGGAELKAFVETHAAIVEWEQKVAAIEKKLKEASVVAEEWLLLQSNPRLHLVSLDEFNDAFKFESSNISRFVREYKNFEQLVEAETKANFGEEDEEMTFATVFADYIKERVPLDETKLKIIDRQSIRLKADRFLKNSYRIEDRDLKDFIANLSSVALGFDDDTRIEKMTAIQTVVERVLADNYPENIPEDNRVHLFLKDMSDLRQVGVYGMSISKLEGLKKVINFIEEVRDFFADQKLTDRHDSVEAFISGVTESVWAKVDWTKLTFMKSLFLSSPVLKSFPQLARFIYSLYRKQCQWIMDSFAPGDKTDVSALVMAEGIRSMLPPEQTALLSPPTLYTKRKDNFVTLLRGVAALCTQKSLSLQDFKAKVEELSERRHQLKTVPLEKDSPIRRCLETLEEFDLLARILRRVKVFRVEDVNKKNYRMYRSIAEVMKNGNLGNTPIAECEREGREFDEFLSYFEGVDAAVIKYEDMTRQAEEIHCQIEKCLKNSQMNMLLSNLFQLPSSDAASALSLMLAKYSFLEQELSSIKSRLDYAQEFGQHLGDLQNYKKLTDDVEQYKNQKMRRDLQIYLKYLCTNRLSTLWVINEDIKSKLKYLWVFNKLARLLYDPIGLHELETEYKNCISSDFCTESTRKILKEKRVITIIEDRISHAARLRKLLTAASTLSPDEYFELLENIRKSSVFLFEKENDVPNENQVNTLITLMERVEKCFKSPSQLVEGGDMTSYLDHFVSSQLQKFFSIPMKILEWIEFQFKNEQAGVNWIEAVLSCKAPYKLEVDFLLNDSKGPSSSRVRDLRLKLEQFYNDNNKRLELASKAVASLETQAYSQEANDLNTIDSIFDTVDAIRYTYESEQIGIAVRILLYELKGLSLARSNNPSVQARSKVNLLGLEHCIITSDRLISKLFSSTTTSSQNPRTLTTANSLPIFCITNLNQNQPRAAESSSTILPFDNFARRLIQLLLPHLQPLHKLYSTIYSVWVELEGQQIKSELNNPAELIQALGTRLNDPEMLSRLEIEQIPSEMTSTSEIFDKLVANYGANSSSSAIDEGNSMTNKLDSTWESIQRLLAERSGELLKAFNRELSLSIANTPSKSELHSADENSKDNNRILLFKKSSKKTSNKKVQEKKNQALSPTTQFFTTSTNQKENKPLNHKQKSQEKKSTNGKAIQPLPLNSIETTPLIFEKSPTPRSSGTPINKVLKKRKPEPAVEEKDKKGSHAEKMSARSRGDTSLAQSANQFLKRSLFDKVNLTLNSKIMNNKKVSFLPQMKDLDEDAIDRLGIKGNLDANFKLADASSFTSMIKRLKKYSEHPSNKLHFVYGYLQIRSNEVSDLLRSSPIWHSEPISAGTMWIFRSDVDKELLTKFPFLPNSCTPNKDIYLLFLIELKEKLLLDEDKISGTGNRAGGALATSLGPSISPDPPLRSAIDETQETSPRAAGKNKSKKNKRTSAANKLKIESNPSN